MSHKMSVMEKFESLTADLTMAIQRNSPNTGWLEEIPHCKLFAVVKDGLFDVLADLDNRDLISEIGDELEFLHMKEQEEKDEANAILLQEQAEMAANATSKTPLRNLFLCTADSEAWA